MLNALSKMLFPQRSTVQGLPLEQSMAGKLSNAGFDDAVRAIGCDGDSNVSSIVAALDWVADNAQFPAIAVLSLESSVADPMLDAAVASVITQGITVVVAAGNADEGNPFHSERAQTSDQGFRYLLTRIQVPVGPWEGIFERPRPYMPKPTKPVPKGGLIISTT